MTSLAQSMNILNLDTIVQRSNLSSMHPQSDPILDALNQAGFTDQMQTGNTERWFFISKSSSLVEVSWSNTSDREVIVEFYGR